jgi:hypothetical protein
MERRFAIIIGINDYSKSSLNYCVNDANVISENLIKSCNFEERDIFLITSSAENSIKDITGHFENALHKIKENLVAEKDSILFYFAGHGKYYNSNSGIYFQDSLIEIKFIFEKINNLNPKYQCYIIDACESGGKVLTRKKDHHKENTSIIDKYISNSTGILFMYASTQNEYACENSNLEHGIFTHHFIKSIQNFELYDEDGILTPNRIQDYIVKQTLKESHFTQTPVIENRTIGYYPFAFIKNEVKIAKAEKNNKTSRKPDSSKIIDKEYFPVIPNEIRESLFDFLNKKHIIDFEELISKFNDPDYEIIQGENLNIFNSNIESKLTDSIVLKSIREKVIAVENIFDSEREIIKPNPLVGSFLNSFLNDEEKYEYTNYIRWQNPNLICRSFLLKAKTIKKVDFGFSFLIYQSLYGLGVAASSFYLDYNGYTNEIIKGPFTKIYPYKFNQNTIKLISDCLESEFKDLEKNIESWNNKRIIAINEFDHRTK